MRAAAGSNPQLAWLCKDIDQHFPAHHRKGLDVGVDRAVRRPSPSPAEPALLARLAILGFVRHGTRLDAHCQPHLAVERLVANEGWVAGPVKAVAAGGGGRRPAFIGPATRPYSATEVDG